MKKKFFYILGWLFVRPRRWFFWKMIANTYPRWFPKYDEFWQKWKFPNIHWWVLYKTIFRFFRWMHYDAWRPFCKWGRIRLTYPLIGRIIHRIGNTTAGFSNGETGQNCTG